MIQAWFNIMRAKPYSYECQYISTPNNQPRTANANCAYINTGYVPTCWTGVSMRIALFDNTVAQRLWFGGSNSSANIGKLYYQGYINGSGNYAVGWFNIDQSTAYRSSGVAPSLNTPTTITFLPNSNRTTHKGRIYIGGTGSGDHITYNGTNSDYGVTLYLIGGVAVIPMHGRIYTSIIREYDRVLDPATYTVMRNFIPVKAYQQGALYDKIEKKIYVSGNQSFKFVAGPKA